MQFSVTTKVMRVPEGARAAQRKSLCHAGAQRVNS
jgi:hypothetical protein